MLDRFIEWRVRVTVGVCFGLGWFRWEIRFPKNVECK
jgi:hypothetical protein